MRIRLGQTLKFPGAQLDLIDRKFESERFRVVVLLPAAAHRVDIELGGLAEAGLGCVEPGLVQSP